MMNKKSIDRLVKNLPFIDFEGKDPSKFYEQYVTFRSFKDRRVVCYGTNPSKVLEETEKVKGIKSPGIIYILHPDKTYIF